MCNSDKHTIAIDFDGVIHQYNQPWVDEATIPDPPVPGAFEALEQYLKVYNVVIFSTRLRLAEGKRAMLAWFDRHGFPLPLLLELGWSFTKVPAKVYIDDRGFRFTGKFPTAGELQDVFLPWNKKSEGYYRDSKEDDAAYLEALGKSKLVQQVAKYQPGKTAHQVRIEEFMKLAEQEIPSSPQLPSEGVRLLRAKLILEEALETVKALGVKLVVGGVVDWDGDDLALVLDESSEWLGCDPALLTKERTAQLLAEIADGCADLSVVSIGTLSACGIADAEVLREVDRTNLEKFGPGGHKREDGKWVKPENWQPPRLKQIISRQV